MGLFFGGVPHVFCNKLFIQKNFYKFLILLLTKTRLCDIISKRSAKSLIFDAYGGIAQLARATGSYPVGHGFKSNSRYQTQNADVNPHFVN